VNVSYGVDEHITHYEPATVVEPDGIAIVSGGMDSITMVYHLLNTGSIPHLLSFDYGQRHKRELDFALQCAQDLELKWSLVDLTSITGLINNSALTSKRVDDMTHDELLASPLTHKHPAEPVTLSSGKKIEVDPVVTGWSDQRAIEVPDGHYAEENMALTVVPNRNMMMMSIAIGTAVNMKGHYIAAGMHAGDHAQYPDCRPQFVADMYITALSANKGFIADDFTVLTPWLHKTKNDIAQAAFDLGVPLSQTWSCYKGGDKHCGRCGTCVERLEAIASVETAIDWDRTEYEDSNYWRQAVAEFKGSK
jgi:7-cyano-7-deazaguanine synthase